MLLDDLYVVLKVAEMKSITAAAESLDMQTATASAAVKRVEKNLGIELFIRTTRQLRLSPAGEKYLPHCQQAMQTLEFAKQNIKHDLDIVDGEIRLAVSSDLGRNVILPWLDEFLDIHPNVTLKLHMSDSNIDFYRDSVDLALRYGALSDVNLYGFKICDIPRILCAAPAYLKKHGRPTTLDDLQRHNGLFYQLHDVIHDVWLFNDEGKDRKIKMSGNRAGNDGDLVRRWCVQGKGIAAKSSLDMANDLLDNRVELVLPEFSLKPTELWLVCPSRQSLTPAVRLLREFLTAKCEAKFTQLQQSGLL